MTGQSATGPVTAVGGDRTAPLAVAIPDDPPPEVDRHWIIASAFDNVPIGIAVLTLAGVVTMCNPAMGALLGREAADLVGTTFFDAVHPDDLVGARQACEALHDGEVLTCRHECRFVRDDGSTVWVSMNAARVSAAGGRPPHLVMRVEDVTERKALEAALTHRALHDALTGLPNRVLLAERIEHAYTHRGRHARPNCLFYIDLNGFKAVNDRFGHATGDRVLQLLAERITALLRPEDTAARLGGDEFAVLCVDVEPQHCDRVAERLRGAAAEPFTVDDHSITISAAVGIVTAHALDPTTPNVIGLLHQADRHMYAQKRGQAPAGDGGPGRERG